MNNWNELYALWCENAKEDSDLVEELKAVAGDEAGIQDRFYQSLEFGTAGLRGVIGAGTNRMNVYTVGQATQGLAASLLKQYDAPSVAIAYDSRIKSEVFARKAACVLAANGVKAYIFKELVPTPVLSFAVRYLGCKSGIVITASHNPSKYNGFKCYDPDGYQMTDESAAKTLAEIRHIDMFRDIKSIGFEEGLAAGTIEYCADEVMEAFLSEVQKAAVNPGICQSANLNLIYSPLNGTGNKPVREILKRIGIENVEVVPEQELPDGNFPTCPYPNPEIRQVFEKALEMTARFDADLILATDPDCDRVGIAVKDRSGEYKLMSGNEVGAMLLEYLLSQREAKGTIPPEPVAIKSFVTTNIANKVAAKHGCRMKEVLTGFKYIGEYITDLEKQGKENNFILGFEESYGYLSGTHARDKDAVVASMLICEMAAYYKSVGKNLIEVMQELYAQFGIYKHTVVSLQFEGAEGMAKMQSIMQTLREDVITSLAGLKVEYFSDYKKLKRVNLATDESEDILLPSTNALVYELEKDNLFIIRPSGTEPKIKAYITACTATEEEAQALSEKMEKDFRQLIGE
ncbi:MAG: phospho-sugar mutase [Ruminococcaceae bacterium]|nr:phospho-sugar mutase [Oscillospiraceae bacterium]